MLFCKNQYLTVITCDHRSNIRFYKLDDLSSHVKGILGMLYVLKLSLGKLYIVCFKFGTLYKLNFTRRHVRPNPTLTMRDMVTLWPSDVPVVKKNLLQHLLRADSRLQLNPRRVLFLPPLVSLAPSGPRRAAEGSEPYRPDPARPSSPGASEGLHLGRTGRVLLSIHYIDVLIKDSGSMEVL